MKRSTFFQFASPSIIIMFFLMVIPLAMAVWLGLQFMTFSNINEPQFVGLRNYTDILTDPRFWQSFRFTAFYAFICVPTWVILGFLLAMLLDQFSRIARGIYLAFLLLPFIVVPIVSTSMFRQLFEPSGLMTWFLNAAFDITFRYDEQTVKGLIILFGIWYYTPFTLVVYFAGLQTIPHDLLEAASIDGASRLQKTRYVIIPHVQALTLFILLFTIMDAYRVFDSVYIISELNPLYKADTIMTYTFQTAITVKRLGKANAMAILTVIGILIVLIPNLYRTYKDQIEVS